jgi:hypothetical protein
LIRFKHVAVAALLILAVATSCTPETVVFGASDDEKFQERTLAAIKRDLINAINQPAIVTGKFESPLAPDFVRDGDAFLMKTEFGDLVVVIPQGKYENALKSLRRKDPVRVFGNVITVTPPGKEKVVLAIQSD